MSSICCRIGYCRGTASESGADTFFGDHTKAAGGNIIAHSSTYRIYFRKSGEKHTIEDNSPYHPEKIFYIPPRYTEYLQKIK
ncbi:MAG: hypothetical protein M3Y53_12450 [Thermoproteota archaeon]|nr:hypothetical protein [Thermoproteota archaeon]